MHSGSLFGVRRDGMGVAVAVSAGGGFGDAAGAALAMDALLVAFDRVGVAGGAVNLLDPLGVGELGGAAVAVGAGENPVGAGRKLYGVNSVAVAGQAVLVLWHRGGRQDQRERDSHGHEHLRILACR